eukprot:m.178977 g.178977  ORF g.178977 m.178977 type:complete len:686 (-) comp31954_c2_seq1:269-2326(-)
MSATKKTKMSSDAITLAQKCINTIRVLSAETVQSAKSGHPGAPMGCSPMAHLLWSEVMKFSPENPKWASRDRFVLSNGHACALQYTMLHLTGYKVTIDDLKNFRQIDSITPGHPEVGVTEGVEVSTGPLGQGISNAVGLAIAETHLAAKFNKPDFPVVDNFTYVICGDGCLQEGVSGEASSLAGTMALGKLIVLYDDNDITIDGGTELSFTEDVTKRYEAYGWHTQKVGNGDSADLTSLREAVKAAQAVTDRPSIISVKTIIGFGAAKQGTHGVHGAPIGDDDIKKVKADFGLNPDATFEVPAEVASVYSNVKVKSKEAFATYSAMFAKYSAAYPTEAAELERTMAGKLPEGYAASLPRYTPADKTLATRQSSQQVLSKLVDLVPELIGGSADLTPSNLTKVEGNKLDYSKTSRDGKYIRFGVREHAMCSISNGICAYGGSVPFAATFLVFAGYCLGAMRLSALSHFRVLYVYTHDSIGLGEDGPTHQPIETLISLRSIPNMTVMRPADSNEVTGAYIQAMENAHGPTVFALSRQGCVNLPGSSPESVAFGAYTVQKEEADLDVVLVATGSEVQLCVAAAATLKAKGVSTRVVSFPCWSLFEQQSAEYKASVFPEGIPVLSVEAASTVGWSKYAHCSIGMTTFGASGKGPALMKHFGFSEDNVVAKAQILATTYKRAAPTLQRPF